jgi:hypothetical protein
MCVFLGPHQYDVLSQEGIVVKIVSIIGPALKTNATKARLVPKLTKDYQVCFEIVGNVPSVLISAIPFPTSAALPNPNPAPTSC